MAASTSKIYKRKCPVCLRKREVAIREQKEIGESCGHRQCAFKREIKEAIEKKYYFKIRKVKPPHFKIEEKKQLDIFIKKLRKKIKITG
ncbi:MAG: hypothetical protein ACOCWA_08955 [Bacteroidota bacterium]